MKPIRVLILISGLTVEGPNGGIARHAVELSRTLDPNVAQPVIGAMWDYGTPHDTVWLERLRQEESEAFVAARWDDDAQYMSCVHAWRAIPECLKAPADIIHSHGEFSDLAALLLRKKLGARAIVRTVHNEVEWSKRPYYGKLFPQLLYPLTFDCELGVSEQVVANLDRRPLARARHRRAVLMRSAVSLDRFDLINFDPAAKRRELGLPLTAPLVGSVGRLTRQKGYDVLLNAFRQVLAHHSDAYLLVAGIGPEEESLRRTIAEWNMTDRAILAGSRSDVEELLRIMDVFVSSSRFEGLPAVILESMASGTPVVATNTSGTVEIVRDGSTGLLVQQEDPEALATAIDIVLTSPERAQAMASNAESMVREEFSFRALASKHEAVYTQLFRAAG
jgi:glycosyltransferase involved in cell wall biosynthesis